jgi:HlyD family secretion protein
MTMSPRRAIVPSLLSGVVVLAGVGCEAPAPANSGTADAKPVTRVEVVRPERATVQRTLEQPGQIEAVEVTPLQAKLAGYVESWTVDIGAKVKKGQVLAVLSVPELDAEAAAKLAAVEEATANSELAKASAAVAEADLATARAKLELAHSGIKRVDADLTRWQAELRRVEQLFNERALTGSLLDETRSKLHSSEASHEELEAQVHSAEAGVRQGEALLVRSRAEIAAATSSVKVATLEARRVEALRGYAKIVSPYDGVVTRRNVDVGQLTDPGPKGEPLFVVTRVDRVRLTVGVPEIFAAALDPGDRVLVRVQALGGRTFEGTVSRNAWSLDAHNRTVRAEVDLPNPDGLLRPGLYANARVVLDEHANVLAVPNTAIVRDGPKAFCAVVSGGKVARVPLTLGLDDGMRTEVVSGLAGGESIVKAGAASLTDGQSVEVIQPEVPVTKGKS